MNYIYCITNLINNKRYVGKTTQTPEERFKRHCIDCNKERCEKRSLYDAMNKYGVENFKVETLEEIEDETILSEKEIYWIKELQTYGKNGYNASKGGDGTILYDYQEFIDLYNLGYSSQNIANKTGTTIETINTVLRSKGIKPRKSNAKKIDQYDLNGNLIQFFFGSLEAAEWCVNEGLSKSVHSASNHILECCKGKIEQSMGYKWVFGNIPE